MLYSCLVKYRARSALMEQGKSYQGRPLSLHPCRNPAVCLIHAIKNCVLWFFLGRVREAAREVASSCWELAELMATGCQSSSTPQEEEAQLIKSGSMWWQQKGSLFYSVQILLSSLWRLHEMMLEPLWDVLSPWSTMPLLLSHASSRMRGERKQ